jgi:hypothetical protein
MVIGLPSDIIIIGISITELWIAILESWVCPMTTSHTRTDDKYTATPWLL